ncbi:unnamed protein product [Coregonus sp. 'balchen']|nr:unnamed protein product [Coregonus sp. 'balchen']
MDKLSQTNDDLRYHLSITREELEQRERYIDTLNQQLVIMSSASREHVHQLGEKSQTRLITAQLYKTGPNTAQIYQTRPASGQHDQTRLITTQLY